MHSPYYNFLGILGLLPLIFSCSSTKYNSQTQFSKNESFCVPSAYILSSKVPIFQNADSILAIHQSLLNSYSKQNVLMITALKLNDAISELATLKGNTNTEAQIKAIRLKEEINTTLIATQTELNATSAELDCEGERIEQIAKSIDSKNNTYINRLTVASIVLGAAASIAGILISDNNWNNGITIGAGIGGGGLAFGVLKNKGHKIELYHKRNLLRNIWSEKNLSSNFPPFVWFMLSEKQFSNSGETALIKNIKKRWIEYQFEGNEKDANESFLFLDNGIYHSDDLHNRSEMINQLQSTIRALNQNLNFLILEIKKTTN